ncbi:MAG TPA: hypothetical protein VFK80_04840 [Limnochordia bacterium]|nr:hypothetical protein [Limnochordia bacterium]
MGMWANPHPLGAREPAAGATPQRWPQPAPPTQVLVRRTSGWFIVSTDTRAAELHLFVSNFGRTAENIGAFVYRLNPSGEIETLLAQEVEVAGRSGLRLALPGIAGDTLSVVFDSVGTAPNLSFSLDVVLTNLFDRSSEPVLYVGPEQFFFLPEVAEAPTQAAPGRVERLVLTSGLFDMPNGAGVDRPKLAIDLDGAANQQLTAQVRVNKLQRANGRKRLVFWQEITIAAGGAQQVLLDARVAGIEGETVEVVVVQATPEPFQAIEPSVNVVSRRTADGPVEVPITIGPAAFAEVETAAEERPGG